MRKPLLLALSFGFFAAACGSEGLPSSYQDQDDRTQTQYVAACESGIGNSEENPAEFCECSFFTVANTLTYDQFIDLDRRLRDDPEALTFEERELLESVNLPCEFDATTINTTPVE